MKNEDMMDDAIENIVDDYLASSRLWLLDCNRSALGTFAYPDFEYLVIWQASLLADHEFYSGKNTSIRPVLSKFDAIIHDYQMDCNFAHHSFNVLNEVMFWWSISDDTFLSDSAKGSSDIDLLQSVYDHPARLSYFEAGLRDTEIMDRYIADGIDSNIAAVLEV